MWTWYTKQQVLVHVHVQMALTITKAIDPVLLSTFILLFATFTSFKHKTRLQINNTRFVPVVIHISVIKCRQPFQ